MLACMTSRQIADWMAFATLEPIGAPVPPDKEDQEKAQAQAQRAKIEGGFRALIAKQEAG